MNIELVQQAASHFIHQVENFQIEPLGNGLIHETYKAGSVVLQSINRKVFQKPEDILSNYFLVYEFLQKNKRQDQIPAPVLTKNGENHWTDPQNHFWRATHFVPDSYSPALAETKEAAQKVAGVFAGFTRTLSGIEMSALKEIIPGFHHLDLRYDQFEAALSKAPLDRLLKSTHLIAAFRERDFLVRFYQSIKKNPAFPERVMHHDCKISNILFSKNSNHVICPVDLDTLMPGKYFSDLGDMIRSMACTEDENSISWEMIGIKGPFYKAILEGYLEKTADILTKEEKDHIHYSGMMMIYMQGIRFLADYLNGDTYYKISYSEQNLDRSMNQLILLEKLEGFLRVEFGVNFK